jgi:hypothetical protein
MQKIRFPKMLTLSFLITAIVFIVVQLEANSDSNKPALIPVCDDVTIVLSGKAAATIVIPVQPSDAEKFSAAKFQFYVQKISGAELPIVSEGTVAEGNRVLIGAIAANRNLIDKMKSRKVTDESSIVTADSNTVHIVGVDDIGTIHATYFTLEDFGCRWYLPGEWGTVIPDLKTLVVKAGEKLREPSFKIRSGLPATGTATDTDRTWALNEWGRGNHLGGYKWWGAGHSYNYLISDDGYFESHPEWFALIDGKRDSSQLCTTNPEMRKEAAKNLLLQLKELGSNVPKLICISPNDSFHLCECDECKKLIPDMPDGQGKNVNDHIDRIVDFANYMCIKIQNVYPEHYVTYYCNYHSTGTPKLVKPAKNTVFWLTQWGDDEFRSVDDETRLGSAINNWKKFGNPLFLYTYWGSFGSYSFWPVVHTISKDIPYFYEKGVIGVYSETHRHWGGQHLNFIVFSRLLWDVNTNVEAYIDEFCTLFYGPAAKPMREYYRKMELAAKNGLPVYNQQMEQMVPVFNKELLAELRTLIDKANAEVANADPVYRTRMDFVTKGFRLGECYFGAQNLIQEYAETKDPSIRNKAVEMFEESLKIINDPKYKRRLTEYDGSLISRRLNPIKKKL